MELNSCVAVWIASVLLISRDYAAAFPEVNLDCTNDFERFLSCDIEAQNCSEYNLTLESSDWVGQKICIFKQSNNGQCNCLFQLDSFYSGDKHKATVWRGDRKAASKIIDIRDCIKPKTPKIISINESNGNYKVVWLKNMEGVISLSLRGQVTYRRKGDSHRVSEFVNQTPDGRENYNEISGRDLKPSTTYLVSVKSFSPESGKFSDSSEESEFTTAVSSNSIFLALVISLSLAAVLISSAAFACYVKFKPKWLEKVWVCPNPTLLDMYPSQQEILKPTPAVLSTVCVESPSNDSKLWLKDSSKDSSSGSLQQSSGISTGSSCFSYANTEPASVIAVVQDALSKAFASICPESPSTMNLLPEFNKDGLPCSPDEHCVIKPEDMNSGSSCFLNKTYSILIPGCTQEVLPEISDVQAELHCDSAYHPSEGVTVCSTYQQTPVLPILTFAPAEVSAVIPIDMSYQPLKADSGMSSYEENSGSTFLSSGTDTTAPFDFEARLDKMIDGSERVIVCDENPCYNPIPAESQNFLAVDFNYQPFQSLVAQPGNFVSETDEKEKLTGKQPQSLSNTGPSCPKNVFQGGQSLAQLQRPCLSLVSVEQSMPMITESDYQCL